MHYKIKGNYLILTTLYKEGLPRKAVAPPSFIRKFKQEKQ